MPVVAAPPPAEYRAPSPAPGARVTELEAQAALAALSRAIPGTRFVSAWPASFPGFVAVKLESGEVAFTDKTGRYLFLGLILDTSTGAALERQLDGKSN